MVVNPASPQLSQTLPVPRAAEQAMQGAAANGSVPPEATQPKPASSRIIEPTNSTDSQKLDSGDTNAAGVQSPPWDMKTLGGTDPPSSPPSWRQPEAFHQSEDLAELLAE
ncbi:MAG: hypothetical protein ACYCW6_01725 [Candidatus Xenobia bacterium]